MEAKLCVQVELPSGFPLQLGGLKPRTLVSVVKDRIEQQAGILPHTYRLTYLDAAPLEDHKTLGELDVVCGGTLRAVAWRLWHEVVTAALQGDALGNCVLLGIEATRNGRLTAAGAHSTRPLTTAIMFWYAIYSKSGLQ